MAVNTKRVLLGALVGGVVWNAWSFFVNVVVLAERYKEAQETHAILPQPRFGAFPMIWTVMLFVMAWLVASLYAAARASWGAGPMTALKIGVMVGFASGVPGNFANASWGIFSRWLPLWWSLDFFLGAVLAAVIAGWLYRD